jgi:hypothetical protein
VSSDADDASGSIVRDLVERLQGTYSPGISLGKLLLWSAHLEVAIGGGTRPGPTNEASR